MKTIFLTRLKDSHGIFLVKMDMFPTFLRLICLILLPKYITSELSVCNVNYISLGEKRGGRLLGHLIETHQATRSVLDCISHCGRNSKCVSVNFDEKNRNCELSEKTVTTATSPTGDFVLTDGTIYFELKSK